MSHIDIPMLPAKKIALIAHDNMKADLLDWATYNRAALSQHSLFATGTTGMMLARELDMAVVRYASGPMGGDQQIGAAIVDQIIDMLVFFWDPLAAQPHDPDVKALLRMAVVWDIPLACNRASADFLIASPLMTQTYSRRVPDYKIHQRRAINI